MEIDWQSSSKRIVRAYLPLLIIASFVIVIDQVSKALVRAQLELGAIWIPWEWLEPYARIVHWKNTGAAFGMLQSFGDVFMVLAIVVAIAILYYFPQVPSGDWPLRLAMGLQFGGAVGNLIDRLSIGWVTDFISVGSFPVFNVADASISTGVAVLLVGVWLKERQRKPIQLSAGPDSASEKTADPIPEEGLGE